MKRLKLLLCLVMILTWLPTAAEAVSQSCAGIKPGQKILWEGLQLVPGQVGKLTVLQDTPLFSLPNGQPKQERILKAGGNYRIYSFKENYYGVGGALYVKRDQSVTYKTPSKQKLQDVICAQPQNNPGNGGTQPPPATVPKDPSIPSLPSVTPNDLGPQVYNYSTIASKAGMDKEGNAYLYIILHGNPISLAIVDLNTDQMVSLTKLGNSTSAWGMDIDRDGVLWIGGTNGSRLYSYDPNTKEMQDYGEVLQNVSDTSIQDLVVTDNYVYGSSAYGSNVFAFNKKTGKTEYILATKNGKYAKSLAVDENDQHLYASSGPFADLFHWNLTTKTKESILTEPYRNESYVDKMKLIGDYLAVKFYPSKRANLYNVTTGTFLREFIADSRGFSAKNNATNEFYYTYNSVFYGYNLETGMIRETKAALPDANNALSLDFVRLKNNSDTEMLTGLYDNNGNYYIFNPVTNELNVKHITLPTQPVDLYLLFSDQTKENIYVNGYMTGGLTKYDPEKETGIQFDGVNQLESAMFLNGKLYVGVYPKAKLVEVTPGTAWELSETKELLNLNQFEQDRITAMTSYQNHLLVGAYPQYSTRGGLLLDYNLENGEYTAYEDYIPNQSIITLLADGDYVYGGTTVYANYKRTEYGAQFFRFNPQNPDEKTYITLPVKASLVMSLIKGPDGNIWGAADGTVFSYNPKDSSFRTVKLFNAISGTFNNATLLVGTDGFIYGTIEGRLIQVNPNDMSCKILLESGAYQIAQDAAGNIYYRNGANLYQYPLKF